MRTGLLIAVAVAAAITMLCAVPGIRATDVANPCPGENEVYNECGPACQAACGDPEIVFCVDMCVAGCFCKPGYWRSASEACVRHCDQTV